MYWKVILALGAVLGVLAVIGRERDAPPITYDVTGTVFYKGVPIDGEIRILPIDGRGTVGAGFIEEGRFRLRSESGTKRVEIRGCVHPWDLPPPEHESPITFREGRTAMIREESAPIRAVKAGKVGDPEPPDEQPSADQNAEMIFEIPHADDDGLTRAEHAALLASIMERYRNGTWFPAGRRRRIPYRYNRDSVLEAVVLSGGSNHFTFDLE